MATNTKYATTLSSQLATGPIADHDFATGAYVPAADTSTLTVKSLSISADTGVSKKDFITKTAEQTITGSLTAKLSTTDHLWGSLDNGNSWEDITDMVDESSGKSITWTGAELKEGSNAIVFRIIDAAGNESARTSGQAYVLDKSINNLTAVLAHDTGTSASDRRTSDATVNIGGLEKNAAWQYSTDNGNTWKQGHGTSIAASVFKTGDNTLMVKQTDKAGNESGISSLNFTLYAKIATHQRLPLRPIPARPMMLLQRTAPLLLAIWRRALAGNTPLTMVRPGKMGTAHRLNLPCSNPMGSIPFWSSRPTAPAMKAEPAACRLRVTPRWPPQRWLFSMTLALRPPISKPATAPCVSLALKAAPHGNTT